MTHRRRQTGRTLAVSALTLEGWAILVLVALLPTDVLALSTCTPEAVLGEPLFLAELQVWHGLPSHAEAFSGAFWLPESRAYDSRDRDLIKSQIAAAKTVGIDGFVIDWYGPPVEGLNNSEDRAFMDEATATFFDEASKAGDFCLALLYDQGTLRDSGLTTDEYQARAALDLSYADQHYLPSPAFLELAGKPALFVFPYSEVVPHLDWPSLRAAMTTHQVTLLDKDPDPEDPGHDANFDGFYSWISPGAKGWDPLGLTWGQDYLTWFYQTMASLPYSGKVKVGGIWPGFDDHLAPWGSNRFISRRDSNVYGWTWALAEQYEVSVLMIATWNDYEEGSDMESGVLMQVDMEAIWPEILLRSSPIEVTWSPEVGTAVLQLYQDGQLIWEELREPPVSFSLESDVAYELKLWTGAPAPFTRTLKIRGQDPSPAIVFIESLESGDLSRWSSFEP